jgi:protein-S-isoprenylcysteine O-methyltransferase Ste14
MALRDEFETQGNWLFRWRSYLPLTIVPLLIVSFVGFHWPFGSYEFHEDWEFACLLLSFSGLLARILAVGCTPAGTSGRNTKKQYARSLNTTGIYSVVRHPLYLGNYLIGLGAALVTLRWWLPVIYTLAFWIYYERIMAAEEEFLDKKFGIKFDRWASKTPAFVPRLSRWRPARYPFSLRTVLKREYTALLVIIFLHSSIETAEFWVLEHRLDVEASWLTMLASGVAAYVALWLLKKRTNFLEVPGR